MNLKNELYNAQGEPYKKSPDQVAFNVGSKLAVAYAMNKAAGVKLPGTDVRNLRFASHFTVAGQKWYDAPGIARFAKDGVTRDYRATARETIWNFLKGSEEQLFKIPRAFSLSTLYGRGVLNKLGGDKGFHIGNDMLQANFAYLEAISQGKINKTHLEQGIIYRGGKLFSMQNEELLHHAIPLPGKWAAGKGRPTSYTSRLVEALYKQRGMMPPRDLDLVFTGGQDIIGALKEVGNSFATVGVQNFVKLLDDPFEMVRKVADDALGSSNTLSRISGKASGLLNKLALKDMFGVGGYQFMKSGSAASLLKRHALRGLPKLAVGMAAIKTADAILKSTPLIKDTALGGGLKGVGAAGYQIGSKTYARVSDMTGMTALSKWQEEKAQGSTSLLGLLSHAASYAIAGGTVGGVMSLVQQTEIGSKAAAPLWFSQFATQMESKGNAVGEVFRKIGLSRTGRTGAFAAIGAAAGLAATLPFIPGALGSKYSKEELDEIYSGQRKVAQRRGKGWEFGTSPFSGTDIEYYAPHWSVRAITDAAKKSKLPEEYYNNPYRYAAERLFNPYALEEKLDEERPYTYWGATDYGLGFTEKLLEPLKRAFKPTLMAHPEAEGAVHPSQVKRKSILTPGSAKGADGLNASGYIPQAEDPSSARTYLSDTLGSMQDMMGLQGFALSGVTGALTGGQGFLTPNAVYEHSGRIMSAQRAYWDENIGGAFTMSEAYRRLNPDRSYDTEHISAPIRNLMPSWIPEGGMHYGDPYAALPMGDIRLPGRGYAALHPELRGMDPEDYPLVHRLNILSDVAPMSPQYFAHKTAVEQQIVDGDLNGAGVNMYKEVMRQREERESDSRFDYGNDSAIGKYYLGLKKFGRSLPTESLYPISPVHKFAGNVDPLTEYKSFEVLDKQFKLWQHPVSDFAKPTYNRLIDFLSVNKDFTPKETKERAEIESYFTGLQYAKNKVLDEKSQEAADNKDFELASYYRQGKRKTIFGENPMGDIGELTSLLPKRQQRFIQQFAGVGSSKERNKVLKTVAPEMQQILAAQWAKSAYMSDGDFDGLKNLKVEPINGLGEEAEIGGNMPERNFVGYAPGVDLNAFKVKTVNNLGKNIRDYGLWREDERQAQVLDAIINASGTNLYNPTANIPGIDRDLSKKAVEDYLSTQGMRGAAITATPISGRTVVDMNVKKNNRKEIYNTMKDQGWISTM